MRIHHNHGSLDRAKSLNGGRLGARSEGVGQAALATILTVLVEGHLSEAWLAISFIKEERVTYEDTSTALRRRAFTTETLDLAVGFHLVVLQDGHLDLLALVLDLLGGLQSTRSD